MVLAWESARVAVSWRRLLAASCSLSSCSRAQVCACCVRNCLIRCFCLKARRPPVEEVRPLRWPAVRPCFFAGFGCGCPLPLPARGQRCFCRLGRRSGRSGLFAPAGCCRFPKLKEGNPPPTHCAGGNVVFRDAAADQKAGKQSEMTVHVWSRVRLWYYKYTL